MMRFTQVIFISLLCGFSVTLHAQQQGQVPQEQTQQGSQVEQQENAQPEQAQQAEAQPAQAQPDGKMLYTTKGCLACHGPDGNKPLTPTYPTVAGQNYEYTLNQLRDFKSGGRNNGQSAIMVGIVAALTDEDMQKIATHLTAPAPAAAADTPAVAEDGSMMYFDKACIACHGAGGNVPVMDAYPKIGGQTEMYLLAQMKDIKSGTRNNSHTVAMTNIMNTVSDEEMASLAKWLSTQNQ